MDLDNAHDRPIIALIHLRMGQAAEWELADLRRAGSLNADACHVVRRTRKLGIPILHVEWRPTHHGGDDAPAAQRIIPFAGDAAAVPSPTRMRRAWMRACATCGRRAR